MCGLFGFVRSKSTSAKTDNALREFANDAMITGVLRGDDSFGVAGIDLANKVSMAKWPVSSMMVASTPALRQEAADVINSAYILIGHHRQKTTGKLCTANAHPFYIVPKTGQHIVGAHNGTLSSHYYNEDSITFDVDSQYLLYKIGKMGIDFLKTLHSGSYALAFTNLDGNFNLARNKHRTLYYAFVKDQNALVYASEFGMLNWLCSRNLIELDGEKIYIVPEDTVLTFPVDKLRDFTSTNVAPPAIVSNYPVVSNTNVVVHKPKNTTSFSGDWSKSSVGKIVRFIPIWYSIYSKNTKKKIIKVFGWCSYQESDWDAEIVIKNQDDANKLISGVYSSAFAKIRDIKKETKNSSDSYSVRLESELLHVEVAENSPVGLELDWNTQSSVATH